MSREAKKKPGELQKARKRHLARQALSDKLKTLKADLEKDNEVWFTHIDPHTKEHKRLRLEKFDPGNYIVPVSVLARVNGRLQVLTAPDKYSSDTGSIYLTSHYFAGFVPKKQVLAVVIREYNR